MRDRPGYLAPLRSGAFRFAVLLAIVFAIGSSLLLGAVNWQVSTYAQEATNSALRTETEILVGEYGSMGLAGLTEAMTRHQRAGEGQFRYLLLDGQGRRLYGDLPMSAAGVGWRWVRPRAQATSAKRIHGAEDAKDGSKTLRSIGTRVADGLLLVVAMDTSDIRSLNARLSDFTLFSGIVITGFALGGGFFVGALFLRRLGEVNAAVGRIMEGSLAERLPGIGFSPEFDRLSANLNRMLDRNAALMEGLRQVSTDIAHDLRTPLTRLHQQLEALRDAGGGDVGAVEDALTQTEDLLNIFQALLRIGALEGGMGRDRFAVLDLSELLDRIHLAYRPVAEDAGKILTAEISPRVHVFGDTTLLAQLFTNLVENAVVHTPPGTRIVMRLAQGDADVTAEVCDNGPGIPAAEHEKVFRRFYRRDTSRNTPGSGLGLSLAAAIAHLHDAEISISDNAPGLCISVAFPIVR